MYKLLIGAILSFSILMAGCGGSWGSKTKIPTGDEGEAKQQETTKERIVGEIEGEFELPEIPPVDTSGTPLPLQRIKLDGVEAEVPSGSKGKIKISTTKETDRDEFIEILSSWKINSAPVQLFVFGGILVAVGIALMVFGIIRIGIAAIAMGFGLIACGVMNTYPWVFLLVILLGLVIGGYFIYTEFKKRKLHKDTSEKEYTLNRIVRFIEALPEEVQEKYFKKPMREDDGSLTIRKVTRKVRNKE